MLKIASAGFKQVAPHPERCGPQEGRLTGRKRRLYEDRVARAQETRETGTVLRFTEEHVWVRVEGERAQIGLSDRGQEELGEVIAVELAAVGESIERGAPFGEVESVRTVQDLVAPVSGTVTAVNADLDEQPMLVNEDPYHDGWLIEVKLEDEGELDELIPADEYDESVAAEDA